MDLLERHPFRESKDVETVRDRIKAQIREHRDDPPLLVRFAMVPDLEKTRSQVSSRYSGCFARQERKRAFFSSLDYMAKHSRNVKEAGELSGYQFVQGSGKEIQYLYIFIFVPVNSSEYMVPTWRNLLLHMTESSACQQSPDRQ